MKNFYTYEEAVAFNKKNYESSIEDLKRFETADKSALVMRNKSFNHVGGWHERQSNGELLRVNAQNQDGQFYYVYIP